MLPTLCIAGPASCTSSMRGCRRVGAGWVCSRTPRLWPTPWTRCCTPRPDPARFTQRPGLCWPGAAGLLISHGGHIGHRPVRRSSRMAVPPSDAIVFFGATGDLAYKQIFPSLLGLVHDEGLNVPIIGVAKAGWTLEQLKARATDSLQHHGGGDPKAIQQLLGLLRYVDGDYGDESTFTALRQQLGQAKRPLHYLAVPPSLFATVA